MPEGWTRTPPSLLRYSDEQTVAGTAAVFAAIAAMGAGPERFEGWGVVAASRYLGRASLAAALRSFRAEGVWGTSPHLIPHFALHSPSGTISLALGLHGPNLGVGGGLHAAAEGFLAALTWLSAGVVPGVWLVLSGWSPELIPEPIGGDDGPVRESSGEIECQALALALRPAGTAPLRTGPGRGSGCGSREEAGPGRRRCAGRPGPAGAGPGDAGEASPRTVATDPAGRVRVELVGGPRGAGVTRHG